MTAKAPHSTTNASPTDASSVATMTREVEIGSTLESFARWVPNSEVLLNQPTSAAVPHIPALSSR